MKIEHISIERLYNLGNYESIRLGVEGTIIEGETTLDAWKQMETLCDHYFQMGRYQKDVKQTAPLKTSNPAPTPPLHRGIVAAERFTDETLKNILVLPNGDIQTNHFIEDKSLWAKINRELEGKGFVWISAGRESRWSQN